MTDIERFQRALREDQDEVRVKRMWEHIDGAARPQRRQASVLVAVGSAVALAAVIVLFVWNRAVPEGLTLEGRQLAGTLASGRVLELSDESRLELDSGARLDVLESSAREVAMALREGRVHFLITPGGPRAWRIECGDVTVEVVGTVFTIDRSPERIVVSVERGSVLVRGVRVPDQVQRLEANDVLSIPANLVVPSDDTDRSEPSSSDEPTVSELSEAQALSQGRPAPRSTQLDAIGLLLSRADDARRAGRDRDAIPLLERAIAEGHGDVRAALAAHSLARMRLDLLDEPEKAAEDFARALAIGLPPQLAEGARAGRAIALARAGSPEAGRALLGYLEAYPQGRYRAEIERWVAAR
jgi:transmembrane sensor